jgi:transcriptional regulator with XRE-family HTH domain
MDIRQQLGLNLRELRLDLGLSQEELAFRSNLHPTHISRLERGMRDPALATLLKLAHGLEVPPGRLVEGISWNANAR